MRKLLDFGSLRDNSEGAKKLTVVGTTIGSPFYMSPEQAQGLPDLDHRADVWSIAAIAYEALTGTVPFFGNTGPQILLAILAHEPTPPSLVTNADAFKGDKVPEALDDVLADSLAKDPSIRIRSVAELADRAGEAYGLEGDHTVWAHTAEEELRKGIRAGLGKPRTTSPGAAQTADRGIVPPPHAAHHDSNLATATGAGVMAPSSADPFHEDDFVMGVPAKSSATAYIIAGVVGLVVVCALAFFLL
jgi:serine/threonine-protein kinase